ncbi:cytochrome c oxidase accessory protein CcoG [Sulfurimonas sp. MAG313]|nr:cytochrome c oxidase accessory protein CcoG [Sulfurimonas sp. MAG313]MDF1881813.1 cytochrome c oxidase accessory protein CcoG [Sulfurimonas sp. MAG313]
MEVTKDNTINKKLSKKEYLKGWIPLRYMRYYVAVFATAFTLIIPWITVNGNHFFLFSFIDFKFHFFFVVFDIQELYLLPFLLMILFIGVFGITVLGGRMFCGWFCPQTIFRVVFRDFLETTVFKLRKRIKNKQAEPDFSIPINQVKRVALFLVSIALAFLAAADALWFFIPPEQFFDYAMHITEHSIFMGTWIGITVFLVYDIVFLKEEFCVYVCPYSRIQSVLYDDDTIMAIYDNSRGGQIYNDNHEKLVDKQDQLAPSDLCTTCESCVTVCPTHIDIRQGLQLECINCLECVDACTTIMAKFNQPSLVNWSSVREIEKKEGKTRYMRPKVLGYGVVLAGLFVILMVMGSGKELMLININKQTRLYDIEIVNEKPIIENSYTVLIQNTQSKTHKFYIDVVGNDKIKIQRPSHPFIIKPGVKTKKTLVLYTTEKLANSDRHDTILEVKLKAYAMDEKDKIFAIRDIRFTYPRSDIIEKKLRRVK